MKKIFIFIYLALTSISLTQECPPLDTLNINASQNLWNIPSENRWNDIEVMTWNIKNFPISNNTINYVNEIITDIKPDIIAFQEINNSTALNSLSNNIPAYNFISSGSGLVIATRIDVIEVVNWTTLFPSEGTNFAWRYPLSVQLNWLCGNKALSVEIINIHLKSGSTNDDFDRRYVSCEKLSQYVNDHPNKNIIILGDYNDEITDSQSNNSLWPLVSNETIIFSTESIANNDYYASYPSWPSFIDHIALSSSLFDELNNNSTIKTIRIDDYTGYSNFQNNISDHRPVLWRFPISEVELSQGLVINEIMQNPSIVPDALGEWFEITNVSDNNINLNGLILRDNSGEEHIISDANLSIHPGSFLVFGVSDNPSLNGGIEIDYLYNNFSLSNLWDQIIIQHPSGEILDEVSYDNGESFPDESGKSMMLMNPLLNNSLGENWLPANITYGNGDYGTPGIINYTNCENIWDLNGDNTYNILDVVVLSNCVLLANCENNNCNGDMNSDEEINVLDIIILVNCILLNNCNT